MRKDSKRVRFFIGAFIALVVIWCYSLNPLAGEEITRLTIFPQGLNLVGQSKLVKLHKGVNQLVFGPISKNVILDSIYPQAEGCEFLEQECLSDSFVSWKVRSEVEEETLLKVVYLITGLICKLNYQVKVDENAGFMDLSGWANIENKSGTDFSQVYLNLKVESHSREIQDEPTSQTPSELFSYFPQDFISYTLSYPVTLKNGERKRILLFSHSHIPVKKRLLFDADKYGEEIREELIFDNTQESGLGDFLPSGGIYIYKIDPNGGLSFVGKNSLDLVLPQEKGIIYLGRARGIKGQRIQTSYRQLESLEKEYSYRMIFHNFRDIPVKIKVVEHFYGEWQILESQPLDYIKRDDFIIYELEIPAEGEQEIQYRARTR